MTITTINDYKNNRKTMQDKGIKEALRYTNRL